MSRPARNGPSINSRERLRQDFSRAARLRELYPRLAEVRVEFEFQDDGSPRPSPQSFAYFPAARGFFRYACPCHACSGEFDLTPIVTELAGTATDHGRRSRQVSVSCSGQRAAGEAKEPTACPICAKVHLSTILQDEDA